MNNLANYINDTENPALNYAMAREYDALNQSAAAVSFYLRTAERTTEDLLAYECLIRMAFIFNERGNNAYTVKGLYQQAINLLPRRPEAYYFLSNLHQRVQEYHEGYSIATLGLTFCDFSLPDIGVDFPGKYALIFEKAVCAWWWGRAAESRQLLWELADNHIEEMDETHIKAVEQNLLNLGSGPESQAFSPYDKTKHDRLKIQFPGSAAIEKNHSQVYQDLFVLTVLEGKKNGTYLEIGGADPFHGNNTALLEQQFNWKGASIEYKEHFCEAYRKARRNPILCKNALDVNYKRLLKTITSGTDIDYLQLDCEPSRVTFEIMLQIPFEKYRFAVITYEHDHYVDISKTYRNRSRQFLEMMGYELVAADISPDGKSSFEDWWVHPAVVNRELVDKMKCIKGEPIKAEDYMFGKIS